MPGPLAWARLGDKRWHVVTRSVRFLLTHKWLAWMPSTKPSAGSSKMGLTSTVLITWWFRPVVLRQRRGSPSALIALRGLMTHLRNRSSCPCWSRWLVSTWAWTETSEATTAALRGWPRVLPAFMFKKHPCHSFCDPRPEHLLLLRPGDRIRPGVPIQKRSGRSREVSARGRKAKNHPPLGAFIEITFR